MYMRKCICPYRLHVLVYIHTNMYIPIKVDVYV